ncbi:MAG: UDP-N-acetylmuramate--L-alanine ligase [Planctomycetes bacterium]|nr:UDP-N-acetylmuramate--L-alanine ligase [Planctomycetota bacterium]MCH8119183.1 UDP-N-acetylmuramate--L-alanine ligase [Planctomycetota bacterium]
MNQPNAQAYNLDSSPAPAGIHSESAAVHNKPWPPAGELNPPRRINVAGMRFHFIGAGGIGMSGLAQLLIKNKAIVAGSDQTPSDVIDGLRQMGADIKIGHRARNLGLGTNAVIISAAIKEDNPELKLARERGYKIYKYAQMLGELMDCYEGIAVSGTHGKSTTSGWLIYVLKQAGLEPNFIIGARISQLGSSSGVADSKYFVAEACEYDRSFLNLKPKIACILNIEQDHLDYYKNENEIVEAFGEFALGVKPDGGVIANGKDANVAKIIMDSRFRGNDKVVRCETFGLDENCNFYAKNISLNDGLYAFDVYHNCKLLGATRISLPGTHNILNALAVVAMAVSAGLEHEQILELLPGFTGIERRLMLKGQFGEITVIDDYAHHPTEIRASLAAIRQRYRPRRIWCVFQPHQYSRTRFLLDDFAESFKLADITIVPEIYFVRDSQSAQKEVNAQILVGRMRTNGTEALFIDNFGAICDYLESNVTAGDVVVTMGAGDIWKVADEYIQQLRRNS